MAEYDVADIISEPVLVLEASARVLQANRAARREFGALPQGTNFAPLVQNVSVLAELLRRFSAVADPTFGLLEVRTAAGVRPYRVAGVRLNGPHARAVMGLRFTHALSEEFSTLSAQVKALNSEIRQHRLARRKLEEALETNRTLYQELQHRVKNHLQIIMAMFGIARRRTKTPGEQQLIDVFERRVGAVAEVQQLMYAVKSMSGVPANELVEAIAGQFREFAGPTVTTIRTRACSDELSNEYASPVALLINELLSNAIKYGATDGEVNVEVQLQRDADGFELVVQDRGPGFAEQQIGARGSGLGLVQGLCRQIGGTFKLETIAGARCTIRFVQPNARITH